ncbi:hypothetical protein AAHA92_13118 [Salvia divinorum]|uniref:Uncharacterized protein n=1 Tax=Salvia divinorum TaxID=28513 RepID=A0ABD1H8G2_SALDI
MLKSRNQTFKGEAAQLPRSKYTSLRDLEAVSSKVLDLWPTSDKVGNPLLRRAAMLYGRTGAPPPPTRRSSSMCFSPRFSRWMKGFMWDCFGFNVDHYDLD